MRETSCGAPEQRKERHDARIACMIALPRASCQIERMHEQSQKKTRNSARGEDENEKKKRGSWLMRGDHRGSGPERKMGAVTTAVIVVIGLLLGWAAVEVACKPCLDSGRAAINRDLNPEYDPDDDLPGGRDSQASEGPYTEAPKQPKEVS